MMHITPPSLSANFQLPIPPSNLPLFLKNGLNNKMASKGGDAEWTYKVYQYIPDSLMTEAHTLETWTPSSPPRDSIDKY